MVSCWFIHGGSTVLKVRFVEELIVIVEQSLPGPPHVGVVAQVRVTFVAVHRMIHCATHLLSLKQEQVPRRL